MWDGGLCMRPILYHRNLTTIGNLPLNICNTAIFAHSLQLRTSTHVRRSATKDLTAGASADHSYALSVSLWELAARKASGPQRATPPAWLPHGLKDVSCVPVRMSLHGNQGPDGSKVVMHKPPCRVAGSSFLIMACGCMGLVTRMSTS